MMLTEDDAKTKRCQESLAACRDVSVGGAAYPTSWEYPPPRQYMGGGGAAAVHTAPLNCIGSACMAWRWRGWRIVGRDDDHIFYGAEPRNLIEGLTSERVGYCGKAGKP